MGAPAQICRMGRCEAGRATEWSERERERDSQYNNDESNSSSAVMWAHQGSSEFLWVVAQGLFYSS